MLAIALPSIVQNGFALAPELQGGVLLVKFTGNGDMSAIAPLAGFLKQLHKEALHHAVAEVHFDLRELYFMNSSCFKSFVSWIDTVARASSYRIRFIANPKQHWQRRSLDALRRLAENVVSIEH